MDTYIRDKKGSNFKMIISTSLAVIILIITFSYFVKSIKDNKSVYYKMINSTMPITKMCDSYEEVDKHSTILNYFLEKANLKVFDPFKIVGLEIPYFASCEYKADKGETFSVLDPFSLNDNSIVKLNPEEMQKDQNLKSSVAFNENLKKTLNNTKPEILIYHSHTAEHYSPQKKDTTDENFNVVGVGNALVKELENYGISVIHDKTVHSVNYEESYKRSNETVSKYLKQYGNFKMIIDLHRDSGPAKNVVTTSLNGENVAKIMFVNAKNSKNYAGNSALAENMNSISRKLFPGFSRGIHTWNRGKNAFNQGLNPNCALIEVGTELNTIEESKNSSKYIARIIAEVVNSKK